ARSREAPNALPAHPPHARCRSAARAPHCKEAATGPAPGRRHPARPVSPDTPLLMKHSQAISPAGKVFAVVARLEAATWAGLLLGMFLKYVTGTTDLGVWLFGRLHGAAFLLYVVVAVVAGMRLRWPMWALLVALLAAVP